MKTIKKLIGKRGAEEIARAILGEGSTTSDIVEDVFGGMHSGNVIIPEEIPDTVLEEVLAWVETWEVEEYEE
jgi:hypothetical protein